MSNIVAVAYARTHARTHTMLTKATKKLCFQKKIVGKIKKTKTALYHLFACFLTVCTETEAATVDVLAFPVTNASSQI